MVNNLGNIAADNVTLTNQLPASVAFSSATTSQGYLEPSLGSSQIGDTGNHRPRWLGDHDHRRPDELEYADGDDRRLSECDQQRCRPHARRGIRRDQRHCGHDGRSLDAARGERELDPCGVDFDLHDQRDQQPPAQSASNVAVTMPIVAGEAFVSCNISSATLANGQLVIPLGNLASNASVDDVQVVVTALSAGVLTETATATTTSLGPIPTASVATQVNPASDLQVAIASTQTPVVLGSDFDYVVTLTNAGPSPAAGVTLSDTLPSDVQFVSAVSDQNITPSYSAGVVTLSLPTFNVGATATLTIEVSPQAAPGSSLTDFASAIAQETNPLPTDGTATLITPVQGTSDLAITAASEQSSVYVGQNIQYQLNVTNNGPNDEPDAVVSFPMPSDETFVSAGSPQGSGGQHRDGGR